MFPLPKKVRCTDSIEVASEYHTHTGHLRNLLATPVTLCKGWQSGSNIHTQDSV